MYHPYLRNKKQPKTMFTRSLDGAIYLVAIVGPLMAFPQVYSIYTTKDVSGISSMTWMAYVLTSIIWLAYGVVHREHVIVLNSFIGGILSFMIFFGILLYR